VLSIYTKAIYKKLPRLSNVFVVSQTITNIEGQKQLKALFMSVFWDVEYNVYSWLTGKLSLTLVTFFLS
jgi:hypothetical protein